MKIVNLAVAFQSETQIAVTLFFQNALRKFTKIFTANNFSQSIDICYFNLSSERFSIHNKEVNKIRNDIVCVVARHAIVFRCVLIIAPAMFFNISFEIKVLQRKFPDYVIATMMEHNISMNLLHKKTPSECAVPETIYYSLIPS